MKVPDSEEEFLLNPATVRRNDRSAQSVVCKYAQFVIFVFEVSYILFIALLPGIGLIHCVG